MVWAKPGISGQWEKQIHFQGSRLTASAAVKQQPFLASQHVQNLLSNFGGLLKTWSSCCSQPEPHLAPSVPSSQPRLLVALLRQIPNPSSGLYVILPKHWLPGVGSCSIIYTALSGTMGTAPSWTLEVKRTHRFPSGNPDSCEHYCFVYVTGGRGKLWSGPAPLDKNLDLKPWKVVSASAFPPLPSHSTADAGSPFRCGPTSSLTWSENVHSRSCCPDRPIWILALISVKEALLPG